MSTTDYETFPTREKARPHVATMRGWDAAAEQIHLPEHEGANRDGNAWVIRTERGYLRTDGYVR